MKKRKQKTTRKIAKTANMSEKDKLRSVRIVKVESNRNRGINPSQIVTLENGSRAIFRPASGRLEGRDSADENRQIRPMTDIEKARQLFQQAGLSFPAIPEVLAAQLKEQGKWLFSTRDLTMSPYNLQHYVHEVDERHVDDYAALAHSGHGVNSYAIQYYLVFDSLRMFLHLGWGGVYMDADADAAKIRECFLLTDQIVSAMMKTGRVSERLTVVGSDFYGSYWEAPGESRQTEPSVSKRPAEILAEVLQWLRSVG
jgi:hypothetical protein